MQRSCGLIFDGDVGNTTSTIVKDDVGTLVRNEDLDITAGYKCTVTYWRFYSSDKATCYGSVQLKRGKKVTTINEFTTAGENADINFTGNICGLILQAGDVLRIHVSYWYSTSMVVIPGRWVLDACFVPLK